jgi:hypothetical protein
MKRMHLLLIAALLAGCAVCAPMPPAALRHCPPLPELPDNATPAQRAAHSAVIVRLYVQCAGAE